MSSSEKSSLKCAAIHWRARRVRSSSSPQRPRRGQPRLPCAVKRRSVASRHSPRQHVLARLHLRADQMPQRIAAGLLPVQLFAHLLKGADQRVLRHGLDQKIHRLALDGGVNIFYFVIVGQDHNARFTAMRLHPARRHSSPIAPKRQAAWFPFPPPFIPIIDIPRQCFHAPPSLGYTERPARVQFMLGRVGLYRDVICTHNRSDSSRPQAVWSRVARAKRCGRGHCPPCAKRCGGRTAASCRGRLS